MGDRGDEIILDLIASDNFLGHVIEGVRKLPDLIPIVALDSHVELALCHLGGDGGNIVQRLDDGIGESEAERGNDRQNRHYDPC
ncbi:hypothetical protein D3C71_1380410 [compost metagenome]